MNKPWLPKSFLKNKASQGFSLLEIAVILAVISILSSFAIPNVLRIGKDADISEAKALLNSAAADCLQALRNDADLQVTPPDENTISDERLKSINYKIKQSYKNCLNFQIEPFKDGRSIAGKDLDYFTFGFKFQDDPNGARRLIKVATKEAPNNIRACESWAGSNCGFSDPEAEARWNNYYAHLSNIKAAKEACLAAASETLEGGYTGRYNKWDTTADTSCKDNPPTIPSTGCKIDSCNQIGFAKDGQPLAGEEALKAALCTEWLDEVRENKDTTPYPPFNPSKDPMGNCPEDPDFWFVEGIDQETEEQFKATLCEDWIETKKGEMYTNKPLNIALKPAVCNGREFWFYNGEDQESYGNLQSAVCEEDREEKRASGYNGIWGPKEGQGVCAEQSYICDRKIVNEYEYYQTCGMEPPAKCKTTLPSEDADCVDFELNEYKFKKCGARPVTSENSTTCRKVGKGKPSNNGWDKTPQCSTWAKCMNLY